MRRIIALISALITGGLSIAMVSAVQLGQAASNATTMTNMTELAMEGAISAFTRN
jgi:hypothetical protein